MIALEAAQRAAGMAYDEAGVSAADVDFAEVYAPCTIMEVLVTEALGLVPRGAGARLCAEGVTSLRGRIPVCPSGGLQARGHPAHVTPLYSFHEIFEQLTGRADDRAVAGAELAVCTAQARQLQRGHGSCAGGRLVTLPIVRIERRRAYPPRATEFTGRFWANLAEGRLETTVCDACDRMTFPPKPFCPHCWSSSISWTELSGRGRLYSQTIVHAAPAVFEADVPYCLGIVDLDDGIRVAMRLISDIPLALDGPVQIVVLSYTDGPLFAACGGCESPSAESTWRPSEKAPLTSRRRNIQPG